MPVQPERTVFAGDFRVGEWLVEPSLDRLSRNGTVLRIRPQLIDVLVLLARHAGRTVSKDEILANVWRTQNVAESCMTRCVTEIRQALEDDAREPKILQTIPKRGYRLVAPVEFLTTHGASAPLPSTDPSVDSLSPEPHPVTRPNRWALGTVVGATTLLALGWGAGGWSPRPVLSKSHTVLLADVNNATGDSAFDGTLRLALAVQLGQTPSLKILPAEHVRSALSRMQVAAEQPVVGPVALEVCRREGAAVLLAGSIARLGSHYAVGLEAIACRSGESIHRELLEAESKDSVLEVLDTAASRLRRALGESRASLGQHDVPLARATTPSLDALKALSLGDYSRDHARLGEALTFYRRATDLDPQFALAWARRGAAARNVSEYDESKPAFQKAYDLRHRVSDPERFYIMAHYYRFVADDPHKALETYKVWKETYPGSLVPPTNLASLYVNVFGQYDAGLVEAREAVRLAPYGSIAHRALILSYMGTNQLAEAGRALREAASRGFKDLLWHSLAFELAFAEGDAAAMDEQVRWAAASPATAMQMTRCRALAAASTGRLSEARRLWAEAAGAAAHVGSPAWQADIKVMEAVTEALLGDARRARAAADAALALDQHPSTVLFTAIALASSGDHARAGTLLDSVADRDDGALSLKPVWLSIARALVEAESGRPERARQVLGPAAPFERSRDFALAPLGIRASLELSLGRSREAAATYRELLRLRGAVSMSPWIPAARLGLARALRDQGDLPGSRAAYQAVLDSMKEADADAPLLVAARRELDALAAR